MRYNAHHEHVASDKSDLLISTINGLNIGWKADTCKYQTHHEKYGPHCEKQKVKLAQTSTDTEESGAFSESPLLA